MGCCSSDSKGKGMHIPSEEKLIRTAENSTIFSRKKLKTLLASIKTIDFLITPYTIDKLSQVLDIPGSDPTSILLFRLAHRDILTPEILTLISILIAYPKKISKASLIASSNREECIHTVKLLLDLAVHIIPSNLEIKDKSIGKYVQIIKAVCSHYKNNLDSMTLEQIQATIAEMSITSADIRLSFYHNYLRLKKLYEGSIKESDETANSPNSMEFYSSNQDRNYYNEIRLSTSPDFNIDDSGISGKVPDSPLNLDSPLLRGYSSGDNLLIDKSFDGQCSLAISLRKGQAVSSM